MRHTNNAYCLDDTFVHVGGAWKYLYRGVDSNGDTLDFFLRSRRDKPAAIAFFKKTLGATHTMPLRVMYVDINSMYPDSFETIKQEGFVRPRSYLRQDK